MSTLEAIILGIIQGLTEFLPVSSSGHLTLGQMIFSLRNVDDLVTFNVVLHMGTLLAIFCIFGRDIHYVLTKDRRQMLLVIIGTLPLFPLALGIDVITNLLGEVRILGFSFLLTATFLFLGERLGREAPSSNFKRDSFFIGLAQALALLPGVSRSGTTISTARMLGWSRESAIRFSFLLAIPAILGAMTLQALTLIKEGRSFHETLPTSHYVLGFLFSFLAGCGALKILKHLAMKGKFIGFAWYCLILGILTIIFVNYG